MRPLSIATKRTPQKPQQAILRPQCRIQFFAISFLLSERSSQSAYRTHICHLRVSASWNNILGYTITLKTHQPPLSSTPKTRTRCVNLSQFRFTARWSDPNNHNQNHREAFRVRRAVSCNSTHDSSAFQSQTMTGVIQHDLPVSWSIDIRRNAIEARYKPKVRIVHQSILSLCSNQCGTYCLW